MLVSGRAKSIIEYLMSVKEPVPVSEIAEQMNVTTRTVYRDFTEITGILRPFGLSMKNSPKEGVAICGLLNDRKRLCESMNTVLVEPVYSVSTRIDLMALLLLHHECYIKTKAIAIDLKVSVQTVRNDFVALKRKMHLHDIYFEAKKGEGVRLAGKEITKRHMFVNVMLWHISPDVFYEWIGGKTERVKNNPFIQILDSLGYGEILHKLYGSLVTLAKNYDVDVSDNRLQEFLIFLALFIKRHYLMEDQELELKPNFCILKYESKFYQIMIKMLKEEYGLQIYENEKAYFSWMIGHLMPSNLWQFSVPQNMEIIRKLICGVEKDSGNCFSYDINLANGLLSHINMMIERLGNGIRIKNPVLNEIYQMAPDLFEIVKRNFSYIFEENWFSEDEIGYIVIYFLNSMERLNEHSISTLMVCTTSDAVSRMLKGRLEREFREIKIKKIVSLHGFKEEEADDYDFVISTVQLNIDKQKYLYISPLLNEQEKQKTRKFILNYSSSSY